MPSYKRYLDETPGVALGDRWKDISPVQGQSIRRVGYPTQKPLAILERITKTSGNEGDIEAPIPYRPKKHVLFGQEQGLCNGCKGDFPFKLFEVDHRVPRFRGGTDHLENLQLLKLQPHQGRSDPRVPGGPADGNWSVGKSTMPISMTYIIQRLHFLSRTVWFYKFVVSGIVLVLASSLEYGVNAVDEPGVKAAFFALCAACILLGRIDNS